MSKTAFEASRFSGFWFNPEDLVVVEDPKDPLFDHRAKLPPSEGLIRDIAFRGIVEPVVIARRGSEAAVVDGRQRVKAAREANKRLKAAGRELVRVPCFLKTGEDADLFGILCAANEHRLQDTPIERAKKAARLQGFGRSVDEIAVTFGVSRSAIEKWLKLLDLPAQVRREVEAGKISAEAALQLRDTEPEVAVAAVRAAVAKSEEVADEVEVEGRETRRKKPRSAGSKRHAAARALANPDATGGRAPKMKSRKQIEERLATPNLPVDYMNALKWVLGHQD